jgi:hypothetical protein
MPNGKIGDHPVSDILVHRKTVYGNEADELIRRMDELSGTKEVYEWWEREIGWSANPQTVLGKARSKVSALEKKARESGWELR